MHKSARKKFVSIKKKGKWKERRKDICKLKKKEKMERIIE